ncbi:hypothetical protein GCM10007933_21360 [Zoogloea oryzae]|uniref:DUF3253 domain-containing protein n=1 Tax=Zoogloea oryzae TaxID=310767 RepID=A0ABQ6FCQ2_9RHOO|nr:hypothetical protein [Zoogloea oryzae]GLT22676.1 hypothetical protein GCM10007933_21360 [Zoogloea oryzae]
MSRARILEILGRHSARNPLPSGDLIALVGGEESDTWGAVEELVRERQVITCRIHRPGGDVVVFWPTGKDRVQRSTQPAHQVRAAANSKARGAKGGK